MEDSIEVQTRMEAFPSKVYTHVRIQKLGHKREAALWKIPKAVSHLYFNIGDELKNVNWLYSLSKALHLVSIAHLHYLFVARSHKTVAVFREAVILTVYYPGKQAITSPSEVSGWDNQKDYLAGSAQIISWELLLRSPTLSLTLLLPFSRSQITFLYTPVIQREYWKQIYEKKSIQELKLWTNGYKAKRLKFGFVEKSRWTIFKPMQVTPWKASKCARWPLISILL